DRADPDAECLVSAAQSRRRHSEPLHRWSRYASRGWDSWSHRLGEGDSRLDDRGCTAMTDTVVERSEDAIAKGSQSFAAAAKLFDRETREDAVMLYAWCRHCDDVIDGQVVGHDQAKDFREGQRHRLAELREKTSAALAGEASGEYLFEALRRVVARHDIPHRHPQELLVGFEMDVEYRRYRTIEETLDYCYHVAGVVGVMMAMIMGVRDRAVLDRASDLGLAFQLTNIARDVIDDARAGRV